MSPLSISSFLQMYPRGFGRDKDASQLWQCGVFAVLLCIWIERNSRIFKEQFLSWSILWNSAVYLASFWALVNGAFRGMPISEIQPDWIALLLLGSFGFYFLVFSFF